MSYYRTCPRCGASLDPGERCDCTDQSRDIYLAFIRREMQRDSVPNVLRPFCQRALQEPCTQLDTLRILCVKLKEFERSDAV